MNHTERLDSTVSLLGNAWVYFFPRNAIACPKDVKAATTTVLQALHCLVTLAEGMQGSYLLLTCIILAISCLAAEIYQHHSTTLAG